MKPLVYWQTKRASILIALECKFGFDPYGKAWPIFSPLPSPPLKGVKRVNRTKRYQAWLVQCSRSGLYSKIIARLKYVDKRIEELSKPKPPKSRYDLLSK